MDEEVDPGDENVNSVLAQESSELFDVLSCQSPTVIMRLCQMMPSGAGWNMGHLAPTSSSAAVTERIKAMLEYFRVASAADCRNFLQSMCILCENIPMRLESRLMSVAGYANNVRFPTLTDCSPLSPSEQQLIKRPRIDHWEQYIASVVSLMLRKWERLSEGLVREVQLENVWVSLRTTNRGRDRPDQTPGPADRGSRTPEPDGDFGSLESKVTLETFLQGCAGKVTVVAGQPGSGKTLLMSCLGQQWAHGLGPIPSSYLFVLLEFRQLNLISSPLSLSELLLRYYLPPKRGDNEKRAIVDYLLSNPEQSCWVLDGYDEFNSKLTRQEVQRKPLDPEKALPVADLISGLLNRQLLPGCTVLVTSRVRDVRDLEGISDKVGQLLGWDRYEIKEYVVNFFGVKGDSANRALGVQAADLLLSSRHLLAMSYLPALCNICCICLKHLLLEAETKLQPGDREEERGNETRKKATEKELKEGQIAGERRGGSQDITRDGTNGRAQLPPTPAQIPSTLTQVYLTVLGAFLSHHSGKKGNSDKAKTTKPPQSTVCRLIAQSQYQSELCELSQLAWRGLEENKVLFLKEDIPQDVLEFSVTTGLLSQVELRLEDGILVNAYCFIHLTIQEFLAALRIMTSNDVSDAQLRKRFSLKTRWMTKSDQRTVFTDSLHTFVCGLASQHCTAALLQMARASGGTGVQTWVQKRQALVLKLLKNLCHSNTLTGPKILELCHCVQESQDHQLAKEVVGTRPTLELRNIRLLPNDIDALAFVVNSVGDNGIGLDFGACSMELECLDVLPRCQYIHYLSFRSRKYGDKFAEKLSSILPELTTLRKLEFCGASLTATGAASLASALEKCPDINEINLSDNSLKDEGMQHIADIFTKLPRLASVMLSRNNSSLKAVDYLIGKMSSCLNIQHLHADAMKEVIVNFSQLSDMSSYKTKSEPTISLLNQKWSKPEMQKVAKSLACCPTLSVLDMSGGQWNVEILRTLTQFLPKFSVTNKIILNDSCSSVEGLVVLTGLLSNCPAVVELHISLQSSPEPVQVSIVFSGGREKPAGQTSKTLCLSCCGLLHIDLERVWRSLGTSCDLTVLDLSSNRLGNKGLRKLLDVLPHLSNIQEINASNNGVSMEGVVMLAGTLGSSNSLREIHISNGGREQVILKFCSDKSDDKQQLRMFRLNNSILLPSDVTTLCRRLVECRSHLELDLSHSSLEDEAIKNLLKVLPEMVSLQRLNVGNSISSITGALILVSCLTVSQRVTSVELRPQSEGFIHFDRVKTEHASCRLTHFSLDCNNLERLTEILEQGPPLFDLDLSSNQLKDEGVKCLMDSLPRLKITSFVNLSNNSLTQQGLLYVASTLCTCDNISGVEVSMGAEERCLIWFRHHRDSEKTLSIRESRLEREHLVRLAEISSNCPNLTKLEFKNNLLHSEWIEDFVKELNIGQRGCSVSIEECWIRAEKAIHLVSRCLELSSNIQTIKVDQTTLHLSLMKPTELMSVSLVDCALEGHQLASMWTIIQRCPSLTELDFSINSLGIEGAESLSSVLPSLPNLTSLSIVSKETCKAVAEKLSEALLQSTTVQCLNLSGHVISDTAAQTMTRMFPRLRSLNLSHCSWSPAEGLQLVTAALRQCVSLEGLCLDSVHLDENSRVCLAQALMNIHSIRRLKLNKIGTVMEPPEANSVLDLLHAMEGLKQMQEIELKGWRLADRAVEQMTRLFPVWTELRKISLSKTLNGDQSGDKLLGALISCSHLEELYLCGNGLGDLTAARMALVLPSMTHLTVLDISENTIGCEGSVSLSKAIICMKNLTKIQLTSVGTSELCAVASSLAHCPLIQDVGLGWNNCGDEVALELARVLPFCQKLNRIDLEANIVTVFGVDALVRALQSCPAVQLIKLWRNKVHPNEAHRLSLKDRRLNFSST
ncbi:LOW QUALITY PROTEIN: NLR family, CARD domain containing 5 [Lates calcarifer]|uniref:LOW QUALITY PROTEIN: NLR family, CARD domain containing 5 n=1 Tax=Lates calcarifer TaxID=8187 RepID=A0AAJ7QL34_LATCA|nr:LOW QUALITY PROTEIN: NLR family, CARD domain containing 5 [Lates calcarifer]